MVLRCGNNIIINTVLDVSMVVMLVMVYNLYICYSVKVRSEITAQEYPDEDSMKKPKHKPKNEKYVSVLNL